jgi:hypothetical protein
MIRRLSSHQVRTFDDLYSPQPFVCDLPNPDVLEFLDSEFVVDDSMNVHQVGPVSPSDPRDRGFI